MQLQNYLATHVAIRTFIYLAENHHKIQEHYKHSSVRTTRLYWPYLWK